MRIKFFILLIGFWLSSAWVSQAPLAESRQLKEDLNVGVLYPPIAHLVSRNDFKITLTQWLEEVVHQIRPIPIKIEIFDSSEAMSQAFSAGELAIVIAPPYTLANDFDRDNFADGLAGRSLEDKPNGVILLSRNDTGINNLHALRGKRLVIQENNELGWAYLDNLALSYYQQPFAKVFKQVTYKAQNNALIYDVFFGESDVAVSLLETYNLMTELNPQLQAKLKILATFPFQAPNYSYFHKRYPEELRKLFIAAALQQNHSPRAQQVFSSLKMGGLSYCKVDELKDFDVLANEYKARLQVLKKCNKQCAKATDANTLANAAIANSAIHSGVNK